MILTRIIQFIIAAIPIVIFGWLINKELVPSGVFVIEHQIDDPSPFINQLLPDQRVEEPDHDFDGDLVQSIVGDPVFFFVHPHRGFDTVDAEVWFKNESVPIVELGGLAQIEGQVYDLKPLQNMIIDSTNWFKIEKNGVMLLQRNKVFNTIADFLVDPPPRHEIATYHYSLSRPYIIDGYEPRAEKQKIDVSLRGFHTFKTYIKDETLNFTIKYMDMNRSEGPDPVSVIVYNEKGEPFGSAHDLDDGVVDAEAFPSDLKTLQISIPDLTEGVYRVELRAERDIFFRSIETTQQKIVFMNNVYLADEVAWKDEVRPVSFWTEAKNLAFQTQHTEGVQDIMIENERLSIEEPYERYVFEVLHDGVAKIVAPNADVIAHTDGHIAFSPEQFFNPDPIRLRENTDLDGLGVNYIIAEYTSPEKVGNWLVGKASFDTRILVLDEGTWKFTFSTPGIEQMGTRVDIGKINMVWHREPFVFSDLIRAIKDLL